MWISGSQLYFNIVDSTQHMVYVAKSATNRTGSLTIPSSVTYGETTYSVVGIANSAFANCSTLTSVVLPASITSIGDSAFQRCVTLTSINIPPAVTEIGRLTFLRCFQLSSITIPNGVTRIGESAFSKCYALTNINIPDNVTFIGRGAFYDCTQLTTVTIGRGLTRICREAFDGCYNITTLNWNAENCELSQNSSDYRYSIYNYRNSLFGRVNGPSTINIGNNVKRIGKYLFRVFLNLTSITIPDSVVTIDEMAFDSCLNLSSIQFGSRLDTIGKQAFGNCHSLSSVTIPNNVTYLGTWAFALCTSLTSVTIGNGVTTIGMQAFENCSSLTSVTIGRGVTSISTHAFRGCSSLTSVAFNADSCTSAWSSSYGSIFDNCTNITNFSFGNNVKFIPAYLCHNLDGLTSVTIPNSVTAIGERAFGGSGLTSITIPAGVTSIGERAFEWCSSLTSVAFNADSCTSSYNAFASCYNITNFSFGDNVKVIPAYLCKELTGITTVTIGSAVTNIQSHAFYQCYHLSTVYLKPTTPPTLPETQSAFISNDPNRVFILTGCSYDAYAADPKWGTRYASRLRDPEIDFTLTVNSNNNSYGTASIEQLHGRDIRCDSTAVLVATPNSGYRFVRWQDNDTQNPRNITVTGDATYTAYFEAIQYTITVNSNNNSWGSVSGGGTYNSGATATLRATPANGYRFVRWQDNNTSNPRNITVTGNKTYTATFEAIPPTLYTITVGSNNSNWGTVSGSGTYNSGDTIILTATPASGYRFVRWQDNNTQNPRTVTVTANATYTAYFEANGAPSPNPVDTNTCIINTFPYSMDFNGNIACWSIIDNNQDGITWHVYQQVGYNNSLCIGVQYQANADDWLYSPYIVTPGSYTVSWKARAYSSDYPESYIVYISSADDATKIFQETISNTDFVNRQATFTVSAGDTVVVLFQYISDDMYYLLIDDIVISRNTTGINDVAHWDGIELTVLGTILSMQGTQGETVNITDVMGRPVYNGHSTGELRIELPSSGVYFVRVGERPARKVMAVR